MSGFQSTPLSSKQDSQTAASPVARAPSAPSSRKPLRRALTAGALAAAFMGVAAAPAEAAGPAQASIVMNADTNETIYSRNAEGRVYPASTTKLITAYLTFEALQSGRLRTDQRVTVSANAAGQPRTNLGLMSSSRYIIRYATNKKGQRYPVYGTRTTQNTNSITVDNALRGLMVHSANDAAVVLGEALGDNRAGFAAMMNAKARQLGMTNTTFFNANGLPASTQVTTAKDMATLLDRLQTDFPDLYRTYLAIPNFSFNGASWRNTNHLLNSSTCPGVTGGKTGYIRASGFNMVVSAERAGHRIIVGVFGGASGASRNALACNLINFAFHKMANELQAAFDPSRTYNIVTPPARVTPTVTYRPQTSAPAVTPLLSQYSAPAASLWLSTPLPAAPQKPAAPDEARPEALAPSSRRLASPRLG